MLRFTILFTFLFTACMLHAQTTTDVDVDQASLTDDGYCPNDSIVFSFTVDDNRNLTHLKVEKGMGEYCNKKYVDFFITKFDSIRRNIPYEDTQVTLPGDEDICFCYKGYYMEGKKWYRKRDYASAITYFDKSISANNEYTKSHRYKGLCQIKLRQIDEGCESLKKAVDLGDKSAKREYPEFCR